MAKRSALFTREKPKSKWRRRFLIGAGLVGGGLAIGAWRLYRSRDHLTAPAAFKVGDKEAALTAWLKVGADGVVTVQVPRQEMGQGVTTALAMLVAEEMDLPLSNVRFEQAPIDALYGNATMLGDGVPFRGDDDSWLAAMMRHTQYKLGEMLGIQATGGSTSVRDAWKVMRQAGAIARAMLMQAAAQKLGVAIAELTMNAGVIEHKGSGKGVPIGEIAAAAGQLPMPKDAKVKSPEQFTLIGKSQMRLDVPAKVDGSAQFGIDARVPGMVFAALVQSPVFGGSVKSFNADKAKARKGVKGAFAITATSTSAAAVAVVAEHYWQAKAALADVTVEWDNGPNASVSTPSQLERYRSALRDAKSARTYESVGDADVVLAAPKRLIAAEYSVPYLAHAAMEPINCTAVVRDGKSCEIWVGNQAPTFVKWFAAKAAGLDSENVVVHTPYLGGGFGRRVEMDVVMQTVALAKQLPGTPVQLIWSREEDIKHDVYRPMALASFRADLDETGAIQAWHNHIVGQSCTGAITARLLPAAASDAMKDKTTSEGAFDLPYTMPNRKVVHTLMHEPIPVGFWRSVGHSYNAFFTECFLDECAVAAKKDPFEYRRAMLGQAPRAKKVLEVVAEKSGWGQPLAQGSGRGIALAESFHAIVAQVAEVEVSGSDVRVRKVTCAIDCGFAVNPENVIMQMESAIIFGLSAALYGEITIANGSVQQSNYSDYNVVRLAETPEIEVHIVNSGLEHLGGVGEPGTPPIAPAVCNAIAAATGKRLRALPIKFT